MSSIGYRPEIDGLRAVSVLGVLLFHAGLGLPGGYVGVDVFFVISGFLITSIVQRELDLGRFTLASFWTRRVRRILPAVVVLVAATLLVGLVVLEPVAMTDLAGSASAQAVMGANVYFWRTTGYFAEAAEYKPLLHTWSLAVEEQFYLVYPLLLVLLARWGRRASVVVLGLLALGSLALGVYATEHHAAAAFYLLPPRAWELLAGGLLALGRERVRLPRAVAELASAGGLLALLAAMLVLDAATPFPGTAALLPVLGATAFVAGTGAGPTLAGRLLAWRPLVFVGLISYSLYLWHWPLFAFARHVWIEVDAGVRVALLAASFVLAVLSWRFVETPFRDPRRLASGRAAARFAVATTVLVGGAALALRAADGLPGRLDARERLLAQDIAWNGPDGLVEGGVANPLGVPLEPGATPDVVVWGDSHARMLAAWLDEELRARGLAGELVLENGVPPLPGLSRPSWSAAERARVLAGNEAVAAGLVDRRVPYLVLISRWANNVAGRNANDVAAGLRASSTLVTDTPGRDEAEASPEDAAASLARALDALLARLRPAGTRVWLLAQVPETTSPATARHLFLQARFPAWNHLPRLTTDAAAHRARQAPFERALEQVREPGLTVVRPLPELTAGERLEAYDERAFYRDDNHLTRPGVERYVAPALGPVLDAIAADRPGEARAVEAHLRR